MACKERDLRYGSFRFLFSNQRPLACPSWAVYKEKFKSTDPSTVRPTCWAVTVIRCCRDSQGPEMGSKMLIKFEIEFFLMFIILYCLFIGIGHPNTKYSLRNPNNENRSACLPFGDPSKTFKNSLIVADPSETSVHLQPRGPVFTGPVSAYQCGRHPRRAMGLTTSKELRGRKSIENPWL